MVSWRSGEININITGRLSVDYQQVIGRLSVDHQQISVFLS